MPALLKRLELRVIISRYNALNTVKKNNSAEQGEEGKSFLGNEKSGIGLSGFQIRFINSISPVIVYLKNCIYTLRNV